MCARVYHIAVQLFPCFTFPSRLDPHLLIMEIYPIDGHASVFNSLIACIVLVVIATISVSLRIWARRVRKVSLWIDDYTIVASLLLLYVLLAIEIAGKPLSFLFDPEKCTIQILIATSKLADAKYGMRTHVTEIPIDNLTVILKVRDYDLFQEFKFNSTHQK